ncbi:hypothetical protein BC826DRAFT_522877 [Russula brevipes]|nr:hypothetical protein BC826DRAFT_522877 [Russula brevipes]
MAPPSPTCWHILLPCHSSSRPCTNFRYWNPCASHPPTQALHHRDELGAPRIISRAPHLRYLLLGNAVCTMGSPLLTPVIGLVRLFLDNIPPTAYFHCTQVICSDSFHSCPSWSRCRPPFALQSSNRDAERELLRAPVMTRVTLPTLRRLLFGGVSAYLEAILPRMAVPLLERLRIRFFNQLTFSIPHVLQFIGAMEDLRFSSAWLLFRNGAVTVKVYCIHTKGRLYCIHTKGRFVADTSTGR